MSDGNDKASDLAALADARTSDHAPVRDDRSQASSNADETTKRATFKPGADIDENNVVQDVRLPFANTQSRSFSLGLALAIASVLSALATYLILTNLTPFSPRGGVVWVVLLVNAALIVAMVAIITRQGFAIHRAWKDRVAGARLHIRIVALFALLATLPAFLLAIAATTTFTRAIDGWFAERTRTIMENSANVANAYLEEHGQVIRTDVINMARDLDDASDTRNESEERFRELVFVQAGLRDLPVAYVIDATGKPLITAIENKKLPYRPPPTEVIALAEKGQVPLLMPRDAYRVAAIVKLAQYPGQYLFVARGVSPTVMDHLVRTQAGLAEYNALRKRRNGLQVAHGLLYFMIALTGLLVAIWAGLWFAGKFVAPIGRLIAAAQHVSRGNLAVRLPERRGEGDLRRLSETFNEMTSEVTSQRNKLIDANAQLLERRRFTEAVLSGVSAGVIGLDAAGNIQLANRSASDLLGVDCEALIGQPFRQALPEFAGHVLDGTIGGSNRAKKSSEPIGMLVDGEERTFDVRLTREGAGGDQGAVVTFDDISELVTAQRATAWADVARRIAHEIKNPLTPIQLSAERIRRKYGKVLTEDREVFDKCTDTIIRHVSDVSRMVDEFSSFAKMPDPEFVVGDLRNAIRESVTLFQMGTPGVEIALQLPEAKITTAHDPRMFGRVITNLVKNAAESVQAKAEAVDLDRDFAGHVDVVAALDDDIITIEVTDNGTGLDKAKRSKLFEPYMTTKQKGTGIGLAITQKIIEQHGGRITLDDAPVTSERETGARATIIMPVRDIREVEPGRPQHANPEPIAEPAE
ncbi:MAG: PAS domain-containing sensor histidine kinase [Pseudomonadota bacterium]